MTDAATYLEEVGNALLCYEVTNLGMVLRVLGRRRGHGVVQRDGQPLRVQHVRAAELLPDAADSGGVIVAEDDVGRCVNHLADLDCDKAGGAGQRLLREGLRSVLHWRRARLAGTGGAHGSLCLIASR